MFFCRIDTDRDGWIQISYEQFMNVCESRRFRISDLTTSTQVVLSAP